MKLIYNKSTKTFSEVTKSFSDWDQIRDLVNDQLPSGITKVTKVKGSDDGKSYQVVPHYKSGKTGKPVTVPINGKSALDNYNRATGSKVENTSKPKISESDRSDYRRKNLEKSTDPDRIKNEYNRGTSKDWKNAYLLNKNTPGEVLEDISKGYKRRLSGDNNDKGLNFDPGFLCNGLLSHDKLTEDTLNDIPDFIRLVSEDSPSSAKYKRDLKIKLSGRSDLSESNLSKLIESGQYDQDTILSRNDLSEDNFNALIDKGLSRYSIGSAQKFLNNNRGKDKIYDILSKGVSDKPNNGNYIYPHDKEGYSSTPLDRELPEVKIAEMIASCYADPQYRWSGIIRQIWSNASEAIKCVDKSMEPKNFSPESFGKLANNLLEKLDKGEKIDKTIKL